jgi:dipeptidyl aminopeptidase/acylaminoacyl peptidase
MVAGAVAWLAIGRAGGARPARARPAGPVPSVNAAAFAGHGELAFVSRGTLWVLDGATRALRRVATPGMTPAGPVFSPDGRWLAFLGTRPGAAFDALWVARGDGSGAHEIHGLAVAGFVGWSPAQDVLAVTTGPWMRHMPYGAPTTVRLVWPSGSVRTVATVAGIQSAVWSPGGTSIAVASLRWPSATALASYSLTGGPPTLWLRLNARHGALGGMREIGFDPVGWWPHQGIGFWARWNCDSCNADGDPFYVISSAGARPRRLGTTLADSHLDQVAAAPGGQLALVAETRGPGMGGRLIWQDRRVKVCHPAAGACTTLPSPPATVTLDPAWSPDSTRLAFVQAPPRASPAFPQHAVTAWYDTHQLWVYDPATRAARRLDASGATAPAWSADGQSLLYIARDGIWLLPRLTGRPVRIATPLFTPGNWPTYYGQVDWAPQFTWWSG